MLEQILLAIIIGCILGTITGITPGIHINLVAALIFAASSLLLHYTNTTALITAITSMAITHTFLDIIPSTFLGAPNPDNALSALPSHKLLLVGKSGEAIRIALAGSFFGLITSAIFSPAIIYIVDMSYPVIKRYIAALLIGISIYTIQKSKSKTKSAFVFLLSGILGISVFSLKTLEQPLFPMLSGLFGISSLIISLNTKTTIPLQEKIKSVVLGKISTIKNTMTSLISSVLTSFLPGLTSSHTTIIATAISKSNEQKDYIFVNNSINTISMMLSFVALFSIDKARNGAVVVISNFINNFTILHLALVIASSLVAAFLAIILCLKLSSKFAVHIMKINYSKLCKTIIIFLTILVLLLTGYIGIITLVTSTFVGLIAKLFNIENTHLMGCLILPVILYFLL